MKRTPRARSGQPPAPDRSPPASAQRPGASLPADDPIAAIVARTRAEQGLPPKIEDPETLDRVARLLLRGQEHERKADDAAA